MWLESLCAFRYSNSIQNWESQRISQYNHYVQVPELQIQLLTSCLLMRLPTLLVTTKTVQPYCWTEAVCSCRVPANLCHVSLPKLPYSRRRILSWACWWVEEDRRTSELRQRWFPNSGYVSLPSLPYCWQRIRFVSLLLSWGGRENFRIATTSIPEHWLSTFETPCCQTCHIADDTSVSWASCWVWEDGRNSESRRHRFPNTDYQLQLSKRLVAEPAI